MSKLFETTSIRSMTLKNRFVRSATWEGLADEKGRVTPRLVDLYARLAQGEVGLIISSHAFVRPDGQAGLGQLGIYGDEHLPGYQDLTRAVHEQGGKVCAQLAHAGFLAKTELTGRKPVAPSARAEGFAHEAEVLTREGIAGIATAMAQAAARAKAAGFDAVQIHAAHTYLLSQFLSPYFNKRADEYGGPVKNRVRAHLQVYAAVRAAVGPDFPVLVKVNGMDGLEGGVSEDDAAAACELLSQAGADAIEVSSGNPLNPKFRAARPGKFTPETEAYNQGPARKIKAKINCPLVLVGGIRSLEVAERLVESGPADYIALARPLIREPDLVKRWRAGDTRPADCLSDNMCYKPIYEGRGVSCPHLEISKN